MTDGELEKELAMLDLERAASSAIVHGKQSEMNEMLLGSMGKDMEDYLSGRKTIEIKKPNLFRRMLMSFDRFLKRVNGVYDGEK